MPRPGEPHPPQSLPFRWGGGSLFFFFRAALGYFILHRKKR
ncbi:gammaproteobacterial enzyme transmembrane domain protein [Clostridium sp. KLE 1755]|nr:gammaproteobacterial enzyme transmembrane domain protein [Clostridium sp. KLE 1755]